MTHEKATPTFCIHVQHSWIYSVTRAACGTLGFDDCIISWHYLIQSHYMHNDAWTKQHPNLLSVITGVCMKDSGFYFSVLHVFFAVFLYSASCIAGISLYSQCLHPSSPSLVNPLFSTHLSPFLISLSRLLVCPLSFSIFFSTSPPQFYPLVLSSSSCQWKC